MIRRGRARAFFSTLGRSRRREAVLWRWVFGIGGVAVVVWAAFFGSRMRRGPEFCSAGFHAQGWRCCPDGQRLVAGQCRGEPRSCPPGLQLARLPQPGCVANQGAAHLAGGKLRLTPSDWESEGVLEARELTIQPFRLDRTEVTVDAWRRCRAAGICDALASLEEAEPGLPVTGVSVEQATRYCSFVRGRLPSFEELVFAAAGTEGRRFPWGFHGLVCRRAVFGMESGPCARQASGPELAGSRPDGATPEGVVDLVGNVAEWTHDQDGAARLFGGSYRSKFASQLKSWSVELPRLGKDVGFRCAYDSGAPR